MSTLSTSVEHWDRTPFSNRTVGLPASARSSSTGRFRLDLLAALTSVLFTGLLVHLSSLALISTCLLAAVWLGTLNGAGRYRTARLHDHFRPLLIAAVCASAVAAQPALFLSEDIRAAIAIELASLLTISASLGAAALLRQRTRPALRLMVVGSSNDAARTLAKAAATAGERGGVRLVHFVELGPRRVPVPDPRKSVESSAAAGPLERLLTQVERHKPDLVMLTADSGLDDDESRRLAWELADQDVDLLISTASFGASRHRLRPISHRGLHAVAIHAPQLHGPVRTVKALLERVAAGLGVIVLAPLLLAIGVAIRCSDRGPALFRQARTGRNGVSFVVYKFRTMRQGSAEQLLALAEQVGQDSMFFKLEHDPRITRFGSFLRKTSLDELPQLFNVVLGNMSLVGPRPLPAEVDQTDPFIARRLRVLPGITGQWQVSGRSTVKGEAAVEHDIDYVDNWKPALDLSILCRTMRAVVRSDGAY